LSGYGSSSEKWPFGAVFLTEVAGTVHAGEALTKVNDVHATGDAMGVVT
jgi:hypothetical protein